MSNSRVMTIHKLESNQRVQTDTKATPSDCQHSMVHTTNSWIQTEYYPNQYLPDNE